jgi:hypothetical protein
MSFKGFFSASCWGCGWRCTPTSLHDVSPVSIPYYHKKGTILYPGVDDGPGKATVISELK